MTTETLDQEIQLLKLTFGEVETTAGPSGQTYIKIKETELPKICIPSATKVLVIVNEPGQDKPLVYVKPGIVFANGVVPRSTSIVQCAGEEWMQFSYNVPWDENTHSLSQFVAGNLNRFTKQE
jgi:hypothetical protein